MFGWEFKLDEEAAAEAPFWMIQIEGQKYPEGAAGAMDIAGQMPDEVPAHWLVYLGVPDADQAVEKTKAAGGQEMFPPTDINIGRIAGVADAQGAGFAVFKPTFRSRVNRSPPRRLRALRGGRGRSPRESPARQGG